MQGVKIMAVDPAFGINDFGAPKMLSETVTMKNNILAILFGRPGSYPSMPYLGMAIQDRMMTMFDTIDEESLKSELVQQCSHFKEVVQTGEFDVVKRVEVVGTSRVPILGFKIPTIIKKESRSLVIKLESTEKGIQYNFKWLKEEE